MLKILVALSAFFSLLIASGDALGNFDKNFSASSQLQKKELYEDVRQAYMRAILSGDEETQKRALERLISGAGALKIDASDYVSDLNELNGAKAAPAQPVKQKQEKQTAGKQLFLLSATKKNQTLVLKFNGQLSAEKLKTFALHQKGVYRNVLDIKGSVNGKNLTYKNFITDEIRIVQYDPTTIRVTFNDKTQKLINAKIIGDSLVVGLQNFIADEALPQPLQKAPRQTDANAQNQENPKPDASNPKNAGDAKDKGKQNAPNLGSSPRYAATKKTVVIDPGHGGTDPGAVNGTLQEKTAVLAVAKKLGALLSAKGYNVFYTRSDDVFINLRDRTKFANDKMADLFVSIHANAAPNAAKAKSMHGIETFFLSPARSERSKNAAALENKSDIEEMNYFSQQTFLNFLNREKIIASNKLGIDIHRELLTSVRKLHNVSDGGVREAPFWVLVGALMPAVLIEIGYITHPSEGANLFNDAYQSALANGIANGIDGYFSKNR
ncbi:N-acetylmuramoyl-L-alanine amidase [uncultured Campylobacter sp.]|uniref:N-acetylmuramoyl-L-alanine amidase n=1 Tax=uncultured Campylobacter sp. TaxID=218934 RepID=UPI0025DD67DB|nr:N-acetylmuramoyl-L-alanine amidase [uncultured Campylobacter sp.]